MTELVVQRNRLGVVGPELGRGGQARVYAAPGLGLPDAPGPLVFKEYRTGSAPPHGLRGLVAVRNRLDPATRSRLDALTCWPLRVVEEAGTVRGVVLPLIPPSFCQERVLPRTGRVRRDPREAQNLMVGRELARHVGMPWPTPAQRLVICRDLAAAVHLVHRLELVIGDINPRNALYRADGRPSVMLLDCDAVRKKGSMSVVAQLNAPDWEAPEGGSALTQGTDRYKLGLFVLRCLAPGRFASVDRDPARADRALDAEGRALLRAALGRTVEHRPTAQGWGRYFDRRITEPAGQVSPVVAGGHRGRRRDASGAWRDIV